MAYYGLTKTRVLSWAKKAGIIGVPVGTLIFLYAYAIGAIIITGYSGDTTCMGTLEEPCIAQINFTVLKNISVSANNESAWLFNTDKRLKQLDARYKCGSGGWKALNFSKTTKFTIGQSCTVEFSALKNRADESIKWGFGIENQSMAYIDPIWSGYSKQDFFTQLYWNKADITYGEASFQFCNPTTVNLPFDRDKLTTILSGRCSGIRNLELSYLKQWNTTVSEQVWIPNVSTIEKSRIVTDNATGLNSTVLYNESVDNGWFKNVNKTVLQSEYLPIPDIASIKAKTCYDIKLHADWNVAYRENGVECDWMPRASISGTNFTQNSWAWWNSTWAARKLITINNSGSALTEYQVQVQLNWTSGMNSTFTDLRFTDNSTTGISLPYWIENYTASTNATVWVKTNLSVGSNTIYMYYGNPAALGVGNVSSTFTKTFGANDLQGEWQMDEGSGTTTADASRNGKNGTLTGGMGWAGRDGGFIANNSANKFSYGSSPIFASNGDMLTIGNMSSYILPTSNWTIMFWFNATSVTQYRDIFFSEHNTGNGIKVEFDHIGVRKLYGYVQGIGGGTSGYLDIINTTAVPTNTWFFIAIRRNGSLYSSFLNNTKISTVTWTTNPRFDNLVLGGISGASQFLGGIDSFQLYNRTLSDAEISAYYFRRQYSSPEPVVLSVGAEEGAPGTKSFYLNLTTSNKTYEQYNTVGILGNTTQPTETLCLSSSHPRKGSLYKCGTGNVTDNWIANNTQNLWSNGQSSWMQSLSGAGSLTFNFSMDKYAQIKKIELNISETGINQSITETLPSYFCDFNTTTDHECVKGADANWTSFTLKTYSADTPFIYVTYRADTSENITLNYAFTGSQALYIAADYLDTSNNWISFHDSLATVSCSDINTQKFEKNILKYPPSFRFRVNNHSFPSPDYKGFCESNLTIIPDTDIKNLHNLSIDFLNDGSIDKQTIGDYINNTIRLSWFNDSTTSKSIQFNTTDQYAVYYLRMPKSGINITSAKMDVNTTLTASSNFTMKCTDSGVTCSASPNFACSSGSASNIIDGDYATGCNGVFWGSCNPTQIDVQFNFSARASAYSFGTYYKLFYNSSWTNPNYGTYRHLLLNSSSGNYTDFLNTGGDSTIRNYVISNVLHFTNGSNNLINWRFNDTGVGYTGPQWVTCNGVNELSFIIEAAQSANYSLDIGFDGSIELNELRLASGVTQANFSQGLTNYLANCTADSLGVCTVPVYLSSKVPATFVLQNLEINYTINPISLSAIALNSYLANNCTGTAANTTCSIPIKISSSTAGNITASYMLDYEGFGSYQWNLTDSTGATVFDSRTVNVTSSRINRTYPTNVRYVEFIPRTRNDVNVSAYGQSSTIPIWNFTWYNYKLNANLSLWLNNTFPDINVSAGTNCSNPGSSTMLTTTQWQVFSNVSFNTNNGLCLWAHYYNSTNRFRVFTFFYKTFCLECW